MAEVGGQPSPGSIVTKEVRWFFDGPLPLDVKMWFTAFSTRGERESRTDVYDRMEAGRGVGVKRRNGASVDAKHRVAHTDAVELRAGVSGRVEEWEKTSRSGLVVGRDQVVVSKEITTRLFDLGSSGLDVPTGCEAELASLRVGSLRAWSLCFETYGDPDHRDEALLCGIVGLFGEGSLPDVLRLEQGSSFGYPEWISRLDLAG